MPYLDGRIGHLSTSACVLSTYIHIRQIISFLCSGDYHAHAHIMSPTCTVQLTIGLYIPAVLDLVYIYWGWLPRHGSEQWMSGFPW